MSAAPILLGVIGRPHGVRGHVHVRSYTTRAADLASYGTLSDTQGRHFRLCFVGEEVAELYVQEAGVERRIADRTEAERLTNTALHVPREALPVPPEEEFYLADLVGLAATDAAGAPLGQVAAVHDYGGGASLELNDGTLLPFNQACVPVVDLAARRIEVRLPLATEAAPP